jgi:hypothetical protein
MRRLLLVCLLSLAVPAAAEARGLHVRGVGGSDPVNLTLGLGHGHGHGLGLGGSTGFPPGPPFNVPPGPPTGFPPGPPPDLNPPGFGFGHGGFPRTRLGHHPLAPVPEPGTAVLLVGGLLGLAWKARERR